MSAGLRYVLLPTHTTWVIAWVLIARSHIGNNTLVPLNIEDLDVYVVVTTLTGVNVHSAGFCKRQEGKQAQ